MDWEFLEAMIQRGFHSQLSAPNLHRQLLYRQNPILRKAKTYDNVSDYPGQAPCQKSDFEKYLIA